MIKMEEIMSVLIAIKGWLTGLDLVNKIIGGIVSFFTRGFIKRLWNRIKPSEEERAFKRAVKSWNSSSYVRGFYKKNRLRSISEFCEYVKSHHGVYDNDIDSLYRLFEQELEKTNDGKSFLQNLRLKALSKDQYESLMRINDILNEQKNLYIMLTEIRQELGTHNKGKRVFSEVEGYIQRYCTQRLKSDEYFKYYLEHRGIGRYKLADIVAGRTEYEGNKFILYSDAQTGKTTELLRLGWELQQEGKLIPIMFRIRGCQSIKQELPALKKNIEQGLVVIIDALDEKFEGDARFGLYHEIETYADEHPHMKIILTCRENFSGEFRFDGFTKLILCELLWEDSVEYLSGRRLGNIVSEIEKHKLYEFVRTPFYLIALADYYEEKKKLPDYKGELYDYFIERRLEQEEGLRLKENAEMLSSGKVALQKMAVAIQLMGVSQITKNDLLDLLDNQYEDYNRVLRSGLIETGEDESYGFTHNSFKEYFVARYLLTLGDIEELQKLCCYSGTKIVRTGWSNIVALLLSQLPKESVLSKNILDWIVEDNKELVLYIDRKLLDEKARIAIFKDILEWHKSKNLRIADYSSSRYEDLMEFGRSLDSIDYLMTELGACEEMDCHTINVLFLLRYVRQEDLATEKAKALKNLLITTFEMFKDDDEHIFVFFEVFSNPWLRTEESVDDIYDILKDSDHPNIVNYFVEYVTDTGCVEKYVDVIIEKGQYIKSYDKDGYTRMLNKDNLYDAYLAFTTWGSIKKALDQLKKEFLQHLVSSTDEKKFEAIIGKLLEKVSKMKDEHPDIPDFVYEMLLDMAEDRSSMRRTDKDMFLVFFDNVGLSQRYFEFSIKPLKDYFLYNSIEVKTYEDHRMIHSKAYCAALLMDGNRLNQLADEIDYKNPNGDSLLSCLSQYVSKELYNEIDVIRKNRYPQFWRDKNAPTRWQIEAQREYDELMDYERFKGKVMKILDEKAPQGKADMTLLRHTKIKLTDEEEEKISRYVCSIFYQFYDDKDDSYDLDCVRGFVEDYSSYQRLVVTKTENILYGENESIKINDGQKELFRSSAINWLNELANEPYRYECAYKNPAISALLHHDLNVDNELLYRLLPYSSCDIYIKGEGYSGRNYSLFDYICERCGERPEFLDVLCECMDRPIEYVERNWKLWCVYLVKRGVTSEYQRAIEMMLSLPCADASLSIAEALLENDETRLMVLKDDILNRCDEEKRLFIYEQLSSVNSMDDFVRGRVENDFDNMDDGNKRRAVWLLLTKGSMKGLEYVDANPQQLDIRANIRGYSIEALPMLMTVYSKVIEKQHRSDCSGVLRAVEDIAEETDEGWNEVNLLFENMIKQDAKKFQHLNWYLREWSVKRMEKASPVMSLGRVKELIAS